MDYNELFKLIQRALWGTECDVCADSDLFEEMEAHAIECLAAPILTSINMPENLLKEWKKHVFSQVVGYDAYLKIERSLPITVPYVILKGTSAGQYYPHPEYRTIGDIDIITRCDDYQSACKQLLDNGFAEITSKNSHERNRHREFSKDGFSVEVHMFFASMNDPVKAEKCDSLIRNHINESHVLPHDINGLVLLEHINQHLEEGLGFRQIIDWMMFVDKELPDDKWREFQIIATETGMEKLAITVTRMCEMKLGLKKHLWSSTADVHLCMDLLTHIQKSGNFGKKRSKEEELASGRAAKLRHPLATIRELQQMGLKNWKKANHPFFRLFAWIWQGIVLAKSTSGLLTQFGANQRLNKMLDALEVRRMGKGLVYYENGKYVRR